LIVKIYNAGRSFKGLANYLTHDPKAQTSERVPWTHSLNCAFDDPLSVVHEMYTTTMQADLLKQEAGFRTGGDPVDQPVKHLTLSWHPDQKPTRQHMIEETQSLLKKLGWEEHQALIVCHTDKPHSHVHVMINAIHPETGLKLNDSLEKTKMQEWAEAYELKHGHVYCQQRLLDRDERTPAPSRQTWQMLRDYEERFEHREARLAYTGEYLTQRDERKIIHDEEWGILKDDQKKERQAFFATGKTEYKELRNAVYDHVRETFRPVWKEYFEQLRAGAAPETLAELKAEILAEQKATTEQMRNALCGQLRQERDEEYKQLLLEQKNERTELRERQALGLTTPALLAVRYPEPADPLWEYDIRLVPSMPFREAAGEVTDRTSQPSERVEHESPDLTAAENPRVRSGEDAVLDVGMGALGAIATIGERLFDGFFGGTPRPANSNTQPAAPERETKQDRAALRVSQRAAEEAAEQEREASRSREYYERRRERYRD